MVGSTEVSSLLDDTLHKVYLLSLRKKIILQPPVRHIELIRRKATEASRRKQNRTDTAGRKQQKNLISASYDMCFIFGIITDDNRPMLTC